jgi:proteasome accessory factor C
MTRVEEGSHGRTVDDAAAQLRRLLLAIPALADDQPHRIADIAHAVGSDATTLANDLRTLVTRFDDGAPGWVEGVRLLFGTDTVQLHSQLFRRPMGLSRPELRALELGLAILQRDVAPEERGALDAARTRVQRVAMRAPLERTTEGRPTRQASRDGHLEQAGAPDQVMQHLALLREAVRRRRVVEMTYRSASSNAERERAVHAYGTVFARGRWFLIAFCTVSASVRVFRVDRIMAVRVTDEPAPAPPNDFSIEAAMTEGRVLLTATTESVRIRYSPYIARWIIEREGGAPEPDGSVVREYPLADDEWAVRHVLQYGPDAIVLSPERVRDAVRQRLIEMGEAMDTPPSVA